MSGNGNEELRFDGVSYMLDREYRNTPLYQWARELARNGIEANAATIQFGVEWRGVESTGTYRLQYADDGDGMTREQLRDYMGTLGRGSKVVGGAHDNYALGSRMTLLPWNAEGVVVISVRDGDTNMVKMMYDPEASNGEGAYVLEEIEWVEDEYLGKSTVYPPYDDDVLKINWADAIPDVITNAGHGTTFVLLGRNPNDDTIDGDSARAESLSELTRKYFNARFWDLPDGVSLRAIEFTNRDRSEWPKAETDGKKYQWRSVRGARAIIEYTKRGATASNVQAFGSETLADGSKAHWWLRRDPVVDTGGVGTGSGFISVLYRGELYATGYAAADDAEGRSGAAMYRQFGMVSDQVRRRVFIVIEPPEYDADAGIAGVAPSTGRADLYWIDDKGSDSVKPGRFAELFTAAMPDEIQAAIDDAFSSTRTDDSREERLRRVMDKFGTRWRAPRAFVTPKAPDTTTEPHAGAEREPIDSPGGGRRGVKRKRRVTVKRRPGSGGSTGSGSGSGLIETGESPAKAKSAPVGLPHVQWGSKEDVDSDGMIAVWTDPNPSQPSGLILMDKTHPVILSQISYWQSQYDKVNAKQIEEIVRDSYADVAMAKVSHVHALEGSIFSEGVKREMLSNESLTMSLLGLISEDMYISPRLGALGGKKKRVAPTETETGSEAQTDEIDIEVIPATAADPEA